MGLFNGDYNRRQRSFGNDENEVEYYEDTHNEKGEYIGRQAFKAPAHENAIPKYSTTPTMQQLPDKSQFVVPRNYQNVVVYEPKTPEDVQILIDYLKRREPAIVNLDNVDTEVAQRVLDFVSGAMYALSGSIHRVAGNIFLLSPEGVEITVPYER